MIKIKDIIDIPSLNYHVEHGLTLHENVYRYSSEKFISLFKEAREALRDGKIQLNEEDLELLESTDIGEYGEYEGEKVPLDLPMLYEKGADTAWEDEEGNKITLQDILDMTKNVPQKDYPTEKLAKVVLNWDDNPEEVERIDQVEISKQYPILIMVDEAGKIQWILDGNHRAQKALRSKAETIPAKLIKPSMLDTKAKKVLLGVVDENILNEEVTTTDKMLTVLSIIDGKRNLANDQISQLFKDNVGGTFYIYTNEEGEYENLKPISKQDAFKYIDYYNSRLKKDYKKEEKLGAELGVLGIESELMFNKGEFQTDPSVFSVNESELDEAEYRGRDVKLNKPERGGPKKFFVYTKNDKGNVVKVNFGGTTGLNVKIDEPGARASFAARHKCAQKKDKTAPGYWACNIGRYWKSLGGKRNFSGYW